MIGSGEWRGAIAAVMHGGKIMVPIPPLACWHEPERLLAPVRAGAAAQACLRLAMTLRRAQVPPLEGTVLFEEDGFAMTADGFRFTTPSGIEFHYRLGGQVIAEVNGPAQEAELPLYLWGTVYGAVAWLNGLAVLHASAVSIGGGAIAFTAHSGGGKSTMAAMLVREGLPLVCDDTLVLAPSSGGPLAIPDAKPLKLWEDALELTGLAATGPIHAVPGKHYCQPPARADHPTVLRHLVLLAPGENLALEQLYGGAKLALLAEALYRPAIHAGRRDDGLHGKIMLGLARSLEVWILRRSQDFRRSEAPVELVMRQFL
ncbi:MAG: hypothetical protein C0510_05925 [Erythrobacter sp.]|nr:hypothetical protein [Erythrobacter sp.]